MKGACVIIHFVSLHIQNNFILQLVKPRVLNPLRQVLLRLRPFVVCDRNERTLKHMYFRARESAERRISKGGGAAVPPATVAFADLLSFRFDQSSSHAWPVYKSRRQTRIVIHSASKSSMSPLFSRMSCA